MHLGDTIFEKGDIRGDGVNIASRLESMAVEGGVFVSKEVHDQLDDPSYLETAYNQVQEKASAMDDKSSNKFLSYPIPKAIVAKWEKVQ